ncbi:methylmalonyl Co-A mutase-associated GTPase MeaB [candidate division WOR-3 bacterium]|nr:methylmalonyl Co-A mutase-associated GTPase MeaB [candidate division WOR-3 bacterium]
MTREAMKRLRSGDKRTIAQFITRVENDQDHAVMEAIFPFTGGAYHIGITGPPGAGKSTLVNALAKVLLEKKKKVGIIAVDPTSPFSGGALLGDRVRMNDLALHKDVYIRSMASRGSLGGLALKTKDALMVLDAAGMDYTIIETIGVGQVELDIAQVCDTTIVVLVPESGDSIQAMKAGLLEIADILVINKSDRPGSDRLLTELKFALEMREQESGWHYPILQTVALEHRGVSTLVTTIEEHEKYLTTSKRLEQMRKLQLMRRIKELIEHRIRDHVERLVSHTGDLNTVIDLVYRRKKNPFRIADLIARKILASRR